MERELLLCYHLLFYKTLANLVGLKSLLLEKAESKFRALKERSLKITRLYHVMCREIDR